VAFLPSVRFSLDAHLSTLELLTIIMQPLFYHRVKWSCSGYPDVDAIYHQSAHRCYRRRLSREIFYGILDAHLSNEFPAGARGGHFYRYACHPSSWNFRFDVSSVGIHGEITDSGNLCHYAVLPSCYSDNCPVHLHPHDHRWEPPITTIRGGARAH
jgi:hypothetical protein